MSSREQATEEAKTTAYLILFLLLCSFFLCRGPRDYRPLMWVQWRGVWRGTWLFPGWAAGVCAAPPLLPAPLPALPATRSFLSLGKPTECSFYFFRWWLWTPWGSQIWNVSLICLSSFCRGHANLLCIIPVLVYELPDQAPVCLIFEKLNRYIHTLNRCPSL